MKGILSRIHSFFASISSRISPFCAFPFTCFLRLLKLWKWWCIALRRVEVCWDFGRALHRRNRTHNSTYAVPGICDHSVFVGLPSTYMDALPFLLPSSLYQTKCTITIVYHQHCSVTAETKAIPYCFFHIPIRKVRNFVLSHEDASLHFEPWNA